MSAAPSAEVRRSPRGTVSGVISLMLFAASGGLLIAREAIVARPSVLLIGAGLVLLLWAGVLAQGLRRPVLMRADAQGVQVRRLFGYTHYAWGDLDFANFDGSDRAVVLGGKVAGQMRYAAFAKRGADLSGLAGIRALFAQYRPGLPDVTGAPAPAAVTEETAP